MFFEVEDYTFAKYESILNGISDGIKYHIWVDGKSTSHSTRTIEEAMAVAMAYKHDGLNSQAAHYFMKMIDFPNDY